jgi:trans-AT polyketide synthase/acyltransferase/oxidoreductase domain-containing protein
MGAGLFVSGAFHSRHMQPARTGFEKLLAQTRFEEPVIPVIANVDAQPHQSPDIAVKLAQQMTSRVRWTESVCYMLSQGVTQFDEIGGGSTLVKLITQTRESSLAALRRDQGVGRAAA